MPFLKPKLVAKAEKGEVIDRAYVIMTYVPGISLGSNWHRANNSQREQIIKQVCHSLNKLILQLFLLRQKNHGRSQSVNGSRIL